VISKSDKAAKRKAENLKRKFENKGAERK